MTRRHQVTVRVAIVSEVFLPAIDGVVTRLTRTLEQFSAAGDDVFVVAPAGGPDEYAGIPVIGVPELRMPLYPDGENYPPKRVALPGRRLGRTLSEIEPDLIHAINPVLLGAGAVAYARQQHLPLIASYHAHLPTYAHRYRCGWLEGPSWRYIRMLHNCADVNLATSNATLGMLRQHGIERLGLWPYGIETERFHPQMRTEQWRQRLSGGASGATRAGADRVILLCVARLAKEKSIERLHAAIRDRDDLTLAIVGDGPLRAELEQRFAGTNAIFHGFLEGEDLSHAYASADIFVLPSDTETLGLVTLEAQASGLPVIAAESPAARELVTAELDGLRFDPGDPAALRTAVDRLVRDRQLRERMGAAARAKALGSSWREATDTLRGFYEDALEARSEPVTSGRGAGRPPQAGSASASTRRAIST